MNKYLQNILIKTLIGAGLVLLFMTNSGDVKHLRLSQTRLVQEST